MDVWCFLENVEKCSCLYTLSKCLTDGFARVLFPKIQDLFILEQRLNRNTRWAKTIANFYLTKKYFFIKIVKYDLKGRKNEDTTLCKHIFFLQSSVQQLFL